MSRYLERAEHTARLIDVNMSLMLDRLGTSTEGRWKRVLRALGTPADLEWKGSYQDLVHALCFDGSINASVTWCIAAARENARQVREELSSEQWQQLNRMYLQATQLPPASIFPSSAGDFLSAVLDGIHLVHGITDSTMSHGEGWQFIQMGRYIERASATASLLDVVHCEVFHATSGTGEGHHYLEAIGLLRSCTAFEAYCKVYTADVTYDRVLDFLLLNANFPHAVRYSIDRLEQAILAVESASGHQPVDELRRVAGRLRAFLGYAEIRDVLSQGAPAYLHNVLLQCREIHNLIYRFYIHYSVEAALAM